MDPTRCPGLEEAFKEQDTSQNDLTNDETLDRCCEAEGYGIADFRWPSALGTSRSSSRYRYSQSRLVPPRWLGSVLPPARRADVGAPGRLFMTSPLASLLPDMIDSVGLA